MDKNLVETAHEMANDLYDAGVIDAVTMRKYDALCFPSVRELSPRDIKRIRLHEKVSQFIFAQYLNITPSTVKQWEQGDRHPGGSSLKLLNLVADKGLQVLT